jgi:hypothetical protein
MSLIGNQSFYYNTIEILEVYFATLFNDIYITRTDANNNVTELMRVPIQFAPKDAAFTRNDQDPTIERDTAINVPRMSLEMVDMQYDTTRALNTQHRIVRIDPNDADKMKRTYMRSPYNVFFNLYIATRHLKDSYKILEQVVPFFKPEFTAKINSVPELNIVESIPIVLDGMSKEDNFAGNFEDTRRILWTLNFHMRAHFYYPTVSKPIIKLSNTNFYIGNTSTTNTIVDRIKLIPGQDANGDATSNASLAVNTSTVFANEQWNYVVTYEDQNS